jgi:hypothetical protein
VIELELKNGTFAYVQYLGWADWMSWVRVLPGRFSQRPSASELDVLVAQHESYRVPTDLPVTLKDPKQEIVGNFPVPDECWERPPVRFAGGSAPWKINDSDGVRRTMDEYAELHPEIEQAELPWEAMASRGLMKHALLIDWHPRDAPDLRNCYPSSS